jgi:hypothetical protein
MAGPSGGAGLPRRVGPGGAGGVDGADVAGEAARLAEYIVAFEEERPEDMEAVRVDRVQLQSGINPIAAGVVGELLGLLADGITGGHLD